MRQAVAQNAENSWFFSIMCLLGIGIVVFVSALFGTMTRPDGMPPIIWIPNAIILGALLRSRNCGRQGILAVSFCSLVIADLISGSSITLATGLASAHFASILTCYILMTRLAWFDISLREKYSILHLFMVCFSGAFISGVVGALVYHLYEGHFFFRSFVMWFTGDLSSSFAILPFLLVFPATWTKIHSEFSYAMRNVLPFLSVVLTTFLAVIISGPGAVAFPICALVWCALTYSLMVNATIGMLLAVFLYALEALNLIPLFSTTHFVVDTISFRIGVTMLVMAPMAIASINLSRLDVIRDLDYALNHDHLTGAMSRTAFESSVQTLTHSSRANLPMSFILIDIDSFKEVNDRYGHERGDQALMKLSTFVKGSLSHDDLWARMGGGEFCALLVDKSYTESIEIAESIRDRASKLKISPQGKRVFSLTISVGLFYKPQGQSCHLSNALKNADRALNRAKSSGKNCLYSSRAEQL